MCQPTTCRSCGKTTWAGCGQHVAEVMAGVAPARWCAGHAQAEGRGDRTGLVSRDATGSLR